MSNDPELAYHIEPRNKFFQAIFRMNRFEHRPGNTVTFLSEVDLSEIEDIRRLAGDTKPSYTAFVAKALGLALKEFPYANRRVARRFWIPFAGPRLQRFEHCDVAIAVERDIPGAESAAFVDILRDVDRLSLAEMTAWLRQLATCDVTTNKQWHDFSWVVTRLPQWLSTILLRLPYFVPGLWVKWRGGAAIISSPAKYGVDSLVATWSWPVGVSFGIVKERPVVYQGEVVARPTFNLVLNFDRRVMAGAQAARFFKRMVERLEHAQTELAPFLPAEFKTQAE
jgi:pyruvate/2-oxoglutarate dehydrogenase complex dihydrolipoamide acyltransferase (E2) component